MFSIIIPTLNEASLLEERLRSLRHCLAKQKGALAAELIVVDGGSSDGTLAIARAHADLAISSERGRARQMNAGAKAAGGNCLLFLHADTLLDREAVLALNDFVRTNSQWGFFSVRLKHDAWYFRVIEWFMNKRSRYTHIATGDQTFCIRRSRFEACGGFANIALMEDVELSTRLRKVAVPWIADSPVICDVRKWQAHGVVRLTLTMWYMRLAYFLGASPERLASIYYGGSNIKRKRKRKPSQ